MKQVIVTNDVNRHPKLKFYNINEGDMFIVLDEKETEVSNELHKMYQVMLPRLCVRVWIPEIITEVIQGNQQ